MGINVFSTVEMDACTTGSLWSLSMCLNGVDFTQVQCRYATPRDGCLWEHAIPQSFLNKTI